MTNAWIRGPAWDGFWILSGLPLGLALTCSHYFNPALPVTLIVAMFLANAHAMAPIAAAWGNRGFRARMQNRPAKYVGLPAMLLLVSIGIGAGITTYDPHFRPGITADLQVYNIGHDFGNPFVLLAFVYMLWNAYHFGMQNFGVLSLYRRKAAPKGSRTIDKLYGCSATWATMAVPLIPPAAHSLHGLVGWPSHPHPFLDYVEDGYLFAALIVGGVMLANEVVNGSLPRALFVATLGLGMVAVFWVGLWVFAIILVNHWLVAIGLGSAVCAERGRRSFALFAAGLALAGACIYAVLFLSPGLTLRVTAWAVAFRIGLGFVHFLYDRWIYSFSDPKVRSTIGLALFGQTQDTMGSQLCRCAQTSISAIPTTKIET
jgi:hypothetical protein